MNRFVEVEGTKREHELLKAIEDLVKLIKNTSYSSGFAYEILKRNNVVVRK